MGASSAQQQQPKEQTPKQTVPAPQQVPDGGSLPEEDESVAPKKFVLNPLESERNLKIGNFYFSKKDYHGALGRYEDATKFNPNSAEAFLKVGQTEEKLHHPDKAKIAFKKVAELAPDTKAGKEAKKKIKKN